MNDNAGYQISRAAAAGFGLLATLAAAPAVEGTACPLLDGKAPRYVDLFDGSPEELAYLIPDNATSTEGTWNVAYVYDAGRALTIRCKYDGKRVVNVAVTRRVWRCNYHVLPGGGLDMACR
jgi:hypothetical protein